MSVSVGDVLRVSARHFFNQTEDNVNVFHFAVNAAPTPNTDAAILADIAEHLGLAYTQLETYRNSALSATDITVYNISDDRPIGVTAWGSGYTGGTGSAESMPHADCCLVLIPTGVKRTQGRIYLSPFAESRQSAGQWDSTLGVAVQAFMDTLTDNTPLGNGTSLAYGVRKESDGLVYTPATYRMQPVVAYQRRRKPGRGS